MITSLKGKKVGIWGFGVVGKSVLSFLSQKECSISIAERRELDGLQKALVEGHQARVVPYELLPQFFEFNDIIIPSPGINLKPFQEVHPKMVAELDLFAQNLKKPVIAVTGSVGKTSVVHILTHLLNKLGKKALAAGNIGFALLDALAVQDNYDILVLELSSFQLQYAREFRADIALVTNIYPNHLDHHTDMEEYVTAKGQLLALQIENQAAFVPMEHIDSLWSFIGKQQITWIAPDFELNRIKELCDFTCPENWQIIISALQHLDLPTENLAALCADLPRLENRIEFLGVFGGIEFYNDSKATLAQSTLNAVSKFAPDRPLLFLGGLSKGVDRSTLVKHLKNQVKFIFCFGVEAEQLHKLCKKFGIESSAHATLDEAFAQCMQIAQPGNKVLFSPAGSSYDLYSDYIKRGEHFKRLVNTIRAAS